MEVNFTQAHLNALFTSTILNGQVHELIRLLDQVLDQEEESVLKDINQILSRKQNLVMLLRIIINTPHLFQKVIQDSYYHENGFHKIVLMAGKHFKLRLHHFGASAKIPMENIHDHRWPFASTILSGQLKMDIFNQTYIDKGGEQVYHFRYSSDKTNGRYKTKLMGITYLQKTESRFYYPGETYLMRTNELHRIKNAPGQESITLILTGKSVSTECNLFAKRRILESEKRTIAYKQEILMTMLENIGETIYPQKN